MSKAFEETREQGRIEGRIEGRAEGRTEGKFSSIQNLMETMNWTAQQSMDALKIPKEEQPKYAAML